MTGNQSERDPPPKKMTLTKTQLGLLGHRIGSEHRNRNTGQGREVGLWPLLGGSFGSLFSVAVVTQTELVIIINSHCMYQVSQTECTVLVQNCKHFYAIPIVPVECRTHDVFLQSNLEVGIILVSLTKSQWVFL